MTTRTSVTHPIRVNPLVFKKEKAGKVSLTFAPGKHGSSKGSGGRWERDLQLDLDRLVADWDIKTLVCLLGDPELDRLKIPTLIRDAQARGMVVHQLPISDGCVPPQDLESVRELVKVILASAAGGDNVVIHCRGGLGRAGTIGACVLVGDGMSAHEALVEVGRARPGAPENDQQKAFVARFADFMAGLVAVPARCSVKKLKFDALFKPRDSGWTLVEARPESHGPEGASTSQPLHDIRLGSEYSGCLHCKDKRVIACSTCQTFDCMGAARLNGEVEQLQCPGCPRVITVAKAGEGTPVVLKGSTVAGTSGERGRGRR
jgi:hypothetical protein